MSNLPSTTPHQYKSFTAHINGKQYFFSEIQLQQSGNGHQLTAHLEPIPEEMGLSLLTVNTGDIDQSANPWTWRKTDRHAAFVDALLREVYSQQALSGQ